MEFQEVMRQWGRYCKGYTENHNDSCDGCPFEVNGSCNSYPKDNVQYAEQIEKHVMSWAADHPEPVYPTWMEWLADVGAIPEAIRWDEPLIEAVYDAIQEHIPADLAQKLGLRPKEEPC